MAYGILYPQMMGAGQGLLAPQAPQAPQMQPQGGLLTMFKPELADNRLYQAFDRGRDTLSSALLGMVGQESPKAAMRGAAQGAMAGNQADQIRREKMAQEFERRQQVNRTIGWLTSNFGLKEDEAMAAAGDPGIMNHYLKMAQGGGANEGPASVQEWNHFNSLSQEDQARYLRMKRANPYLDIGTGFVQPDPTTPGQVSGQPIAKQNYQEKYDQQSGTEDAKVAAERRANAPQAMAKGQQALDVIGQLRNHPGRRAATGMDSIRGSIPGTSAYDFARLNDQLAGKAFLEAFESLKGGGQITEVEGRKATEAIARLDRAQSEEGYLAALKDLEDIVRVGIARAQQGIVVQEPAPTGQRYKFNPATGELE